MNGQIFLKLFTFFVISPALSVAAASEFRDKDKDHKVSSIAYSCNLSFQASGEAFKLGVGATFLHGKGTITCYDFLTGATERIPLKIRAEGGGAGLELSKVSISGGALGIGISTGPESLLGRYGALRVGGAVGIGVGAASALRLSKGAVTLNASIQTETGLGAGVDLLSVELEADGKKEIENAVEPSTTSVRMNGKIIPVETQYVTKNSPVVIVDTRGQPVKVIYLKPEEERKQ